MYVNDHMSLMKCSDEDARLRCCPDRAVRRAVFAEGHGQARVRELTWGCIVVRRWRQEQDPLAPHRREGFQMSKKKVSVESLFIKKATLSSGTEFLTQPGRSLLPFLNIKQNKDHEKLPHQNSILHIYFSLYIWYTLQKVVALPQIY